MQVKAHRALRRGVAVLLAATALVATGCGSSEGAVPPLEDIGDIAYEPFPGAVEFDRRSGVERTQELLDGAPLCRRTNALTLFELVEPTTFADVEDWYEALALERGWDRESNGSYPFFMTKQVGERLHSFHVDPRAKDESGLAVNRPDEIVTQYGVSYFIALESDHPFCGGIVPG